MAECTEQDLRKAREALKMPRWKLGSLVGVSESTIENWERGTVMPEPDDVDRVGEALNDAALWHRWMLSHYDSYRKRYREAPAYALPMAVVNARHAIEDVTALMDAAERDVMDGHLDDPSMRAKLPDLLRNLVAATNKVLEQL